MAPERLRELGRLPVANAVRHLADGQPAPAQHLGGSLHPHRREVLPEGRVADLAEGALELAAGGRHPSRDVVERELGGELARHDRGGVLVEAGPEAYCCWSLEEAAACMVQRGFRHLIVTESGEIAGVLSMRDVVRVWTDDGSICDVPASADFASA